VASNHDLRRRQYSVEPDHAERTEAVDGPFEAKNGLGRMADGYAAFAALYCRTGCFAAQRPSTRPKEVVEFGNAQRLRCDWHGSNLGLGTPVPRSVACPKRMKSGYERTQKPAVVNLLRRFAGGPSQRGGNAGEGVA
jgi:hypothetical protein